MNTFTRDDGTGIRIVPGFRDHVLAYRSAVTPRDDWNDKDYCAAAAKKRKRFERILRSARARGLDLERARVLDVGCGDGSNGLLFAKEGAASVEGIDLKPPELLPTAAHQRTRRLAATLLKLNGHADLDDAVAAMKVSFSQMDATAMTFPDSAFDFVMSRSAMEHVRPVEKMLSEMARVTRPGGLIYLSIDPFFWLRGCHKRGVVDIPWAHARLTLAEFRRFVAQTESDEVAAKRLERLETLNRFTLAEWKARVESTGCEVLYCSADLSALGEKTESFSLLGERVLQEHPDVRVTLLPGVTEGDLLHERIKVWLRRTA
jgi:SAM-dependent methyltransferase